jgi:hypothetical protein
LSGGKLYTYAAGTTTPQTTYTSISGLVANENPIILNSEGRVSGSNEVWLTSTVAYKLILKTSTDVQLWSADNLSGIASLGNVLPYAVLCGGSTSTNPIQSIASVGTAGQVLTSNGADTLPTMQASIVAGMIILWSGSSASIPSGWLLCNGTLSTPDLRDRFVVGAGSTYAVNATGGTADAVVVAHTHTGTTGTESVTHTHSYTGVGGGAASGGGITAGAGGSMNTSANSVGHVHTFTTDSTGVSGVNQNLPPYFALCYIMKS